jgi:hypothetical protein
MCHIVTLQSFWYPLVRLFLKLSYQRFFSIKRGDIFYLTSTKKASTVEKRKMRMNEIELNDWSWEYLHLWFERKWKLIRVGIHKFLSRTSYELITTFVWASYKLLRNFVQTSYKFCINFLQIFYAFLVIFQISYELLSKFLELFFNS